MMRHLIPIGISIFMLLWITTLFFPQFYNPDQAWADKTISDRCKSINDTMKQTNCLMTSAFPGPKYVYEEFAKNVTIVGKGDGFWGVYSCKFLTTENINYKITDEKICQRLKDGKTYNINMPIINNKPQYVIDHVNYEVTY